MRTIDLTPLYRSFIGSDHLAQLIDAASRTENQATYPPYNIEVIGEDKYRITIAVAGFSKDELNIELKDNTLTVAGQQDKGSEKEGEARKFLHKGISERNFERKFQLGDYVKVLAADMQHGLLHIDLERVIPEAKKPRQIEIGSNLIEN